MGKPRNLASMPGGNELPRKPKARTMGRAVAAGSPGERQRHGGAKRLASMPDPSPGTRFSVAKGNAVTTQDAGRIAAAATQAT